MSTFVKGYKVTAPLSRQEGRNPIKPAVRSRSVLALPDLSLSTVWDAVLNRAPHCLPSIRLLSKGETISSRDFDGCDWPRAVRDQLSSRLQSDPTGQSLHTSHYVSPPFVNSGDPTREWALRLDSVGPVSSAETYGTHVWVNLRGLGLGGLITSTVEAASEDEQTRGPIFRHRPSRFDPDGLRKPDHLGIRISVVDAKKNPATIASTRAVIVSRLHDEPVDRFIDNMLEPFYGATSAGWQTYGHKSAFRLSVEGMEVLLGGEDEGLSEAEWLKHGAMKLAMESDEAGLDQALGVVDLPLTVSAHISSRGFSGRIQLVLSKWDTEGNLQRLPHPPEWDQ